MIALLSRMTSGISPLPRPSSATAVSVFHDDHDKFSSLPDKLSFVSSYEGPNLGFEQRRVEAAMTSAACRKLTNSQASGSPTKSRTFGCRSKRFDHSVSWTRVLFSPQCRETTARDEDRGDARNA